MRSNKREIETPKLFSGRIDSGNIANLAGYSCNLARTLALPEQLFSVQDVDIGEQLRGIRAKFKTVCAMLKVNIFIPYVNTVMSNIHGILSIQEVLTHFLCQVTN